MVLSEEKTPLKKDRTFMYCDFHENIVSTASLGGVLL